jgi:hypothetical protein
MNAKENRRSVRRQIAAPVQIATGVGPPGSCRMVDVSETGARLHVSHGWSVPDVFLVILKPELQRWCQVVWRTERQIGVMFIAPPNSLSNTEPRADDDGVDGHPLQRKPDRVMLE